MSTSQQSLVTVVVGGRVLGKFASRAGGETTAEPIKDRPGGMAPEETYPGVPTHGDVTVARTRGKDQVDLVAWLRTQCGFAAMSVTDQPLDELGVPFGKPTVYTGTLKSVTDGDSAADSSELRRLDLVMTTTKVA